jgi:hypothetical protein
MNTYDYEVSLELTSLGPTFASLVMAAMRSADSKNFLLLQRAFPEIWRNLQENIEKREQP